MRTLIVAVLCALTVGLAAGGPAAATPGTAAATSGMTIALYIESIADFTQANTTSTTRVLSAGTPGSPYTATWSLHEWTSDGDPYVGPETTTSGIIGRDGYLTLAIQADGVPDGSYRLALTVVIQDPNLGELTGIDTSTGVAVDRTGPQVDRIEIDHPTLYPRVATPEFPDSALIRLHGAYPSDNDVVEIRNSTGTVVDRWTPSVQDSITYVTFRARYNQIGAILPPGVYTFELRDNRGNIGNGNGTLRVSTLHREHRSYRVTVSAQRSLTDRFVGRCSQLRRPASRPWAGSLGFYANTRCKARGWKASAVSTVHAVKLPSAYEYTRTRLSLYGGAARSKANSRGIVRFADTTRRHWVTSSLVGPKVGWHGVSDDRVPPGSDYHQLRPDRTMIWGLVAAADQRYDVKAFRILVEYDVLQN